MKKDYELMRSFSNRLSKVGATIDTLIQISRYEFSGRFSPNNILNQNTINSWLKHADIQTLFNTRGTTYRTLKLKELALSDEDKQLWLAKENMLIKRPVIELDNKVIVGYNESQYLETIH